MKLSDDDYKMLHNICLENGVSYTKVTKMLDIVYVNEFKERRIGIYDELKNILRSEARGDKSEV